MRTALVLAAGAIVALASVGLAYLEGPDPGLTGGFGEESCHSCHFENPLNDDAGQLTLEGLPARYEAGRRYEVTIELAHPEAGRGGFELSARFDDGTVRGTQAGAFAAPDARVQVIRDPERGLAYASHTREGAELSSDRRAQWTLEWTAPSDAVAPVVFHLAANAANDDGSELGDFIYLRQARTEPR